MINNLWAIVFLLLCAATAKAVNVEKLDLTYGDDTAKKAYFSQPIRFWGSHGYKVGKDSYETLLVLKNAKTEYAFRFQGKIDAGKPRHVKICMLRPSVYNWYAGGFVEVRSGNQALTEGEFKFLEIKEDFEFGEAVFEYRSEMLSGIFRFALSEDDDKLQLIFTPFMAKHLESYQLILTAYPGIYGEKEKRQRRILTNASGEEITARQVTDMDHWAVFYDLWYDRGKNLGDGCCAFLYNPKAVVSGTLRAASACTARLNYRAGQIAALVLWDFKGWSSQEAIQYMKQLSVQFE